MPIRRVAVIFDDRLRPDTAGVYVRRALAELVEVVHFRPEDAEAIPRSGFDLYLGVDDDTEHRLPAELRPRAYWAIDTHLDFAARVRRSADCDLVFAAQRDGAERLRAAGIASADWLPLACDPGIHRRHEVIGEYSVAFVGHIFPGPRDELLQAIARTFPGHFIGRAFFDEMARIYSASRVVFNRSLRNDVNMRVFEALACGSMLVTNDLADNGQADLFRDRVHLATYREPGEMLEVIAYYLAHPEEREAIAAAGRAEAVGRHTYRHRMERLLAEAERRLGRSVVGLPPGDRPTGGTGDGRTGSFHHGDHREMRSEGLVGADRSSGCPSPIPSGLASVIVPCWNQCEFTRQCLQALFRFTRPGSWELIVVDNGSTDGTADYLAGVQDASAVPVTVITNPRNVGFPAAVNQGLQVASGDYLVLLNNDAVVTEGWLEHLIALTLAPIELTGGAKESTAEIAEAKKPEARESGPAPNDTAQTPSPQPSPRWGEGDRLELPRRDSRSAEAVFIPSAPGVRDGRGGLAIGLVGPMSNYAAPPQLVEGVPYRDLDAMHAFAGRWREQNRGRWLTAGKLSGFCLLMTRAVYQAVGGLDERFGLGFFDDDDLAVRARRAGFELAVALDVFVHHFGSRTFAGSGIDAEGLLEENARRFGEKWGQSSGHLGRRVTLSPWVPSAAGGIAESGARKAECGVAASPGLREGSAVARASVSLTMIVRDEETNLPHCLESVRGVFDEIVVVDTGSVDRTREIARGFGAKVFEFAWIDDFAAARNFALENATGDYVFWLDADDVVEPAQREKLIALLEGLEPREMPDRTESRPPDSVARASGPWPLKTRAGSPCHAPDRTEPRLPQERAPAAYVVRCACDPGADGSGGETVVDHIRLFPLRPDVRWTYRVHEQIMPALRRAGIPVRWTDLVVRHTGYVDIALRVRKLRRDRGILLGELKDRPEEPFILFNLGAIAIEQKDWHGALEYLGKSLANSAPSDSITRKLFALIARAQQMRGDSAAALMVCAEGLALDPEDAEPLFRKAVVHRNRGEPAEAEACWRTILTLRRPERFASVDMGIYGHLTRRNLAALAAERGDAEEEARLWSEVLAECPGDREACARRERMQGAATRPRGEKAGPSRPNWARLGG